MNKQFFDTSFDFESKNDLSEVPNGEGNLRFSPNGLVVGFIKYSDSLGGMSQKVDPVVGIFDKKHLNLLHYLQRYPGKCMPCVHAFKVMDEDRRKYSGVGFPNPPSLGDDIKNVIVQKSGQVPRLDDVLDIIKQVDMNGLKEFLKFDMINAMATQSNNKIYLNLEKAIPTQFINN